MAVGGCGSSSSSSSPSVAAGTTTGTTTAASGNPNITIAGVPGDLTDQFFTAMKCGAQAAASQGGAKLTWQAPDSYTVSSASTLLNSIATTHPNGIMLEGTFTGTGLSNQVSKFMSQGIPVAIVDAPITPAVYYQAFYSDNFGSGKVVARAVNTLIGGSGDVGIITATPQSSEQLRANGFKAALKAYPNIHVVSLQYANRDIATAAREASAMIAGNPGLEVIYATDGPQAEGAHNAIAAAGKAASIKLIAFDATPQEVQAVRSGQITGLLAQTPYLMAYKSVQALIAQAKSGSQGAVQRPAGVEQNLVMPFMFITKQNVDSPAVKTEFEYPQSC